MSRLIHTGAVVVDVVLEVPHLPEQGGDVVATSSQMAAGGGLNVLTAAQRDGLDVLFAGRRGTGPFGVMVEAALQEHAIASAFAPVADRDSGYCVVLVDATTERTFVSHPGAEEELSTDDLASLAVGGDDLVYVSGYSLTPFGRGRPIVDWVAAVPVLTVVVVDPSPLVGDLDPGLLAPVIARADIVTCNDREATILTGALDPAAAASILLTTLRDGAIAIVRAGPAGTWIADATSTSARLIPARTVAAVDTNGAGDAHTGVLMSGLARGLTIDDAVLRANVAASIAVTRRGPATSPWADETDAAVAGFAPPVDS